jgi:ABC-type Zn uptake system ZnuABC Zn-binding protein ZnuA
MEFKLARENLTSEPQVVSVEYIEERANSEEETIIYFDRTNSQKALNQLVKHFDKKFERNVYVREVRYGLDEKDYLYEVHVL